ncbi:MAG: exodeoxyribonuclease V subunit gamma [Pseudomonadales bacterium]|nr:exodeoxyribonuclease V subunit gamma [Pseudomonadales bacterium]
MLTVYPSNRLEDLAQLLIAVLDQTQGPVLAAQQIIVESKGMQHWLQMQLAASRGIAMNLRFPMPARFIWETVREMLGAEQVPSESPFSEAIMTWRIDRLLANPVFFQAEHTDQVNQYWGAETPQPDRLKRYQLAAKLASVFEQYVLYRPDWIEAWDAGGTIKETLVDGIGLESLDPKVEAWQRHLWQCLVADTDCDHPVQLQKKALQSLATHFRRLPEHIFLFGINTLPESSLYFFKRLAQYRHVHLFHLNPCVEFWGDLQSDKALARQMREAQWDAWIAPEDEQLRNPLLANLGQQGKEFFNSVQDTDHFEISAFDLVQPSDKSEAGTELLKHLQRDILTLRNAVEDASGGSPAEPIVDDSMAVVSCHNSLREIQALHDYLLHQFNQDNSLKPQDIVVMCPEIEDYAPYIEAVFRSATENQKPDAPPRLPCSIADRIVMNEEPLISAFLDVLQLPDSRFEVSKILDFLRVPALQEKFGFAAAELETLEWWLQQACIHWGLDGTHKSHLSGVPESNQVFTWRWGLERLLLGFAHGDHETIFSEKLLLPHVEGQNGVLLGRILHLLDQLQYHTRELTQTRTVAQWQRYLMDLKWTLFSPTEEEFAANMLIEDVISRLAETCTAAHYDDPIEFAVIRYYLQNHFSQPDSGNHFMTGQVTFCSMVPMRSIPFKIIAILGLNDGQFPRQNKPNSFDLMAALPRRRGDRSRRADDRYLFLETLISARSRLYLSFQGRHVRNNEERQPSLVLKELLHYLDMGYGWTEQAIRQQPLHPYSEAVFSGTSPGFDRHWLRLHQPLRERQNSIRLDPMDIPREPLDLEVLVSFLNDPLKAFAQTRLGLFLTESDQAIDDAEPFAMNTLTEYQIRERLIDHALAQTDTGQVLQRYLLSGELPDSPLSARRLETLEGQAQDLASAILDMGQPQRTRLETSFAGLTVFGEIHWLPELRRVILFRPADRKPKDEIRLWLQHLLASIVLGADLTTVGYYGKESLTAIQVSPFAETDLSPEQTLQQIVQLWLQHGMSEPVALHGKLGQVLIAQHRNRKTYELPEPGQIQALISENEWVKSVPDTLEGDRYYNWFFGAEQTPSYTHFDWVLAIYYPMYQHLQKPVDIDQINRGPSA